MKKTASSVSMIKAPKNWVVYILRCSDDTLYTGITNNIQARIARHNLGKGAKYTATRRPVCLIYSEDSENRSQALKREYAIKKLSRSQKIQLIAQGQNPQTL